MTRRVRWCLLAWMLVALACSGGVAIQPSPSMRSCKTAGDCFSDEACVTGICRRKTLPDLGFDGGLEDLMSLQDADPSEAGLDGSYEDSSQSVVDGGIDSGAPPVDSGSVDTGVLDTGIPDSGGPADTGAPVDMGPQIGIDLTGMTVSNAESATQQHVFAAGTRLLPGQVLVLARDATRSDFEVAHSISLGPSVVFVSAGAGSRGAPIINGGESWSLLAADGALIDGPTMPGVAGSTYQRRSLSAPENPGSWIIAPDTQATPGATGLPASGVGLVISEWSDASGTGRFSFEFLELYFAP